MGCRDAIYYPSSAQADDSRFKIHAEEKPNNNS